ncbi:MAG: DUF393 domain-containing protein [Pseudomonadota bacterium]
MSDAQKDQTKDLTVYYDGACPLCQMEISHYKAQTGADSIDFVDATTAELPDDLDRDTALARFHVRRSDGSFASGAAGFAEVWKGLPKWRWAARLAALPGVLWIMERMYRAFLPIRPYLSKALSRWKARGSNVRVERAEPSEKL